MTTVKKKDVRPGSSTVKEVTKKKTKVQIWRKLEFDKQCRFLFIDLGFNHGDPEYVIPFTNAVVGNMNAILSSIGIEYNILNRAIPDYTDKEIILSKVDQKNRSKAKNIFELLDRSLFFNFPCHIYKSLDLDFRYKNIMDLYTMDFLCTTFVEPSLTNSVTVISDPNFNFNTELSRERFQFELFKNKLSSDYIPLGSNKCITTFIESGIKQMRIILPIQFNQIWSIIVLIFIKKDTRPKGQTEKATYYEVIFYIISPEVIKNQDLELEELASHRRFAIKTVNDIAVYKYLTKNRLIGNMQFKDDSKKHIHYTLHLNKIDMIKSNQNSQIWDLFYIITDIEYRYKERAPKFPRLSQTPETTKVAIEKMQEEDTPSQKPKSREGVKTVVRQLKYDSPYKQRPTRGTTTRESPLQSPPKKIEVLSPYRPRNFDSASNYNSVLEWTKFMRSRMWHIGSNCKEPTLYKSSGSNIDGIKYELLDYIRELGLYFQSINIGEFNVTQFIENINGVLSNMTKKFSDGPTDNAKLSNYISDNLNKKVALEFQYPNCAFMKTRSNVTLIHTATWKSDIQIPGGVSSIVNQLIDYNAIIFYNQFGTEINFDGVKQSLRDTILKKKFKFEPVNKEVILDNNVTVKTYLVGHSENVDRLKNLVTGIYLRGKGTPILKLLLLLCIIYRSPIFVISHLFSALGNNIPLVLSVGDVSGLEISNMLRKVILDTNKEEVIKKILGLPTSI